jgi:Xaa-Pro aminopeptidase
MFKSSIYVNRRENLRKLTGSSYILFLGFNEVPRNYPANTFNFRQDSHFLYYAGLKIPNLALLMTPEEDILFGYKPTMDDIVWTGPLPTLEELGSQCGITKVKEIKDLADTIQNIKEKIHYVKPFQGQHIMALANIFGKKAKVVSQEFSPELTESVAKNRNIKSDEEILEIEKALETSYKMYEAAAKTIKPGIKEWDVMAAMVDAAWKNQCEQSFHPIVTIHGEVLHNHSYNNVLPENGLILLDSGAETSEVYASDITRTYPISGKFTQKQKEIYQIVLDAQLESIKMCKPGVSFKDVHLKAAKVIAEGLKTLGLMKGDVDEAVKNGAHALFYPHGLGHMMGIDVHDMEDLGDIVGYGSDLKRSEQFGLAFLRMARKLETGFVFTIEPGIYFIPTLIDMWKDENKHSEFINYDKVLEYKDFGGIRIEDDLLITEDGNKVLGNSIPKEIEDIEKFMNK